MGAIYFYMEKFKPAQLTEQDHKNIYDLSRLADPTARLQSNYYQLRRKQIYADYCADMSASPVNDYNERVKLQHSMQEKLKDLRQEYEQDVSQAIELYLATLNVWQPWRSELQPPAEMPW